MSFTGIFEDQGGTTSSETRAVLLRVVEPVGMSLTLPCQDPRSLHGNLLSTTSLGQKGTEGVEETLKLPNVPDWRPITLWLAVEHTAPKAHPIIRAQAMASSNPLETAGGPGIKITSAVSVVVSSQQRRRYSAALQGQSLPAEKSQSDRSHKSNQPSFPKHFVTLASNKITYDFKMFHEERKPFRFDAICHWQLVTLYCEHLIIMLHHEALDRK